MKKIIVVLTISILNYISYAQPTETIAGRYEDNGF